MHLVPHFFAIGWLERLRAWSSATSGMFQTLVFFGVVTVIALVVFGWALIVREKPHHRHHHPKSSAGGSSEASGGGFFRRHKHRRKKHRPVNPTLSKTGGLPAPRDDKTPPNAQL